MQISCIVPLYNAAKYISEALDSLMNQSYSAFEIIVVDDCSQDESVNIVEDYIKKYENIKLIKQPVNKGASAARNKGIEASSGNWLLFLDADDRCEGSLLTSYVDYIKDNDADMIYSQFLQIGENNQVLSLPIKGKELIGGQGFCEMILRNPIISPSGILIKKEVVVELEGFDESIKYVEDVDLWLRLLLANKTIAYLDIPGSLIRRHASNTTNTIEITNVGEQTILNKFGLALIKGKIDESEKKINEKHLDYINILIRFKNFDLALELLTQFEINKEEKIFLAYLFTKARVYLYFENYSKAATLFEDILKIDPNHGAALNNLGVIEAKNQSFNKANGYFKSAINIFPSYLDAKHNLMCLDKNRDDYKFTYRELRASLLHYS